MPIVEPGANLMRLHPDGKQEVQVKGGGGAVPYPVVLEDGTR
jgi:hypothetical protein